MRNNLLIMRAYVTHTVSWRGPSFGGTCRPVSAHRLSTCDMPQEKGSVNYRPLLTNVWRRGFLVWRQDEHVFGGRWWLWRGQSNNSSEGFYAGKIYLSSQVISWCSEKAWLSHSTWVSKSQQRKSEVITSHIYCIVSNMITIELTQVTAKAREYVVSIWLAVKDILIN